MKTVVFLVLIASCFGANYDSILDYDSRIEDYFRRQADSKCKQDLPNCAKCLQKSSCTWCKDDERSSGLCKSSQDCSSRLRLACSENTLEDQLRDLYQADRSYVLDVKEVTMNASYLCHLKTNCFTCTKLGFCAWCKTKNSCIAYSGKSTTKSCTSGSWYKNQCLYSGFTTPCNERKPNCKDCVSDGKCYWCDSTKTCGYYPRDGFRPANCSSDQWYYKSCSHVREIIVLLPIILFILTPLIAYAVLFCVLRLLRREGYEGLSDSDSSDDDDDDDAIRRPIMLRHGSPGGKTDKLRKKYDLDKK